MAKATSIKKGSDKRDLIAPHGNKHYTKRKNGKFTEMDDQKKSLSKDVKKHAKKKVKPGYGDQGDQKRKQ